MTFRRWWLRKEMLMVTDELQAEAKTYNPFVITYPVRKSDIGVYVFTESELRNEFAEPLWNRARRSGYSVDASHRDESDPTVDYDEEFKDYWTELMNDKLKEEPRR